MGEDSPAIRFVRCQRCNLSMRVQVQPGNPDALLMRYAESGEGLCASCAATLFLHSIEHIKHTIDTKQEMFLWEPMQQQFAALMRAGHADAKPEEINWQHVHDHWELPWALPHSRNTSGRPGAQRKRARSGGSSSGGVEQRQVPPPEGGGL